MIAPDDPRLASIGRCLLCKSPASIRGLFEPSEQALWSRISGGAA